MFSFLVSLNFSLYSAILEFNSSLMESISDSNLSALTLLTAPSAPNFPI